MKLPTICPRPLMLTMCVGLAGLLVGLLAMGGAVSHGDDLIGNNTGGSWSDNTNWQDGSAPVSSTDKNIVITGAATASNQDIATPFILESLSLSGNNSHTLSGNQLQFKNLGSAPSIVVNPTLANSLLQIDADIDLANDLDIVIHDGDLTLNNVISGTSGLNIDFQINNSNYLMSIDGSSANTYTGTTTVTGFSTNNRLDLIKDDNTIAISGDLVIDKAFVYARADNQIAAISVVTIKNNGLLLLDHFQTLSGLNFDSGGQISVNNNEALTLTGNVSVVGGFANISGSSRDLDLGGGNRTFNVEPSASIFVYTDVINGDLTKTNDGLADFRSTQAFTGNLTLSGGTLKMHAGFANNQSIAAPAGTIVDIYNGSYAGVVSGAGNFAVSGGGTLNLSAAQTYTGDTTITNSTLSLDSSELLPDVTDLTISNSTLNVGALDETVATVTLSNFSSINGTGSLSAGAFDLREGTVSVELAGAGNLSKTTFNQVILSGPNSYIGTTIIDQGVLDLNGAERLPDTTDVTINNGAQLRLNNTETVDAFVITNGNIGSIGGTPKLIASSYVVENGQTNVELSGAGGLTKNGTGQFNINAPATYSGNTTINQGSLRISTAGDLPATTTLSIDGNGNLSQDFGVTTSIDTLTLIDGNLSPSSGTGTATLNAATDFDVRKGTVNAILGGAATLTKTTADTVTLNTANTYTGATTISDGVLALATPAAVPGDATNNGILRFQSANGTFAGAISGTGSVEVTNGAITFSGASTYSGATTVSNGRTIAISASERLSDNTDVQLGTSNFFSPAVLDLSTFDDTVNSLTMLHGSINGTGTLNASSFDLQQGTVNVSLAGGNLNKTTSQTTALNSASTFTAVTHENGSISGTGSISANSYDVREGSSSVPLNGSAALTKTTSSLYQINAASGYTGATDVNAGQLRVTSSGSLTGTSAANVNGGFLQLLANERLPNAVPVDILGGGSLSTQTETVGTLTLTDGSSFGGQLTATAANYDVRKGSISNSLAGAVGLVKTTADTVTLFGSNSYSGGTTISAGVLEGTGPAIQGNVANSAVLRYVSGGTSPANISGTGSVEVNAGVTLTGANSYTGGTTVSSSLAGDTDSLQGNIVNNGNVQFGNTASGTYAGDISGSGLVFIGGTAEVLFTGNNTYTGNTDAFGSLALGSNTAIGPGNVNVGFGTNLRADSAARTLSNNFSVLGGAVTFGGTEDLTLTQTALLNVDATTTLTSTNTATTTINREINAAFGSTIRAAGGTFAIGNSNSFTGFKTLGDVIVDPGATLTLQSLGFIDLPALTVMTNGTLGASNGFSLGASENLLGTGTVNGDIAAQIGSIIAATSGDLTVGNAASFSGFFSDGLLITNDNTVTINDKNSAVLGSLTKLGQGSNTGALVAGNANTSDTYSHFLLEQGKDLIGRGNISGHFKNHGTVTSDGAASGEQIVFDSGWTVTGKGTFVFPLFLGTFSPGESPGVVDGQGFSFGGSVHMELGGTTPGSGADHHDQIQDDGLLRIGSDVELILDSWNNFVPELGDEFSLMTWQDGIEGTFASLQVDPWFAQNGIGFELDYGLGNGAGELIARAIETADFNLDGYVDGNDLGTWQAGYGGSLGGGNFLSWQRQFTPASAVAEIGGVPEPVTLTLAAFTFVGSAMIRRRR